MKLAHQTALRRLLLAGSALGAVVAPLAAAQAQTSTPATPPATQSSGTETPPASERPAPANTDLSLAPGSASGATATPDTAPQSSPEITSSNPPADNGHGDQNEIVVTGSRIRQDNYTTPNPIQIVNREEIQRQGARSLTEVLQGTSITSGTAQINNTFLGYVTSGGPGSNTIGLRGLGADRTLVLLNGRRLSPAGTESEVGSADLNVLPTEIVQRVEVLKDGASSVYGSDAIAGVVNIITDDKYNGLFVDGYGNLPIQQGGGDSWRASAVYGKTFDRGHFLISGEFNNTNALARRDRSYARCPTDDLYDPQSGAFVGSLQGTQPRCLPFSYTGGQGIAQDYFIGYTPDFDANRFTPNANQTADAAGDIDGYTLVNSVGKRPGASGLQQNEDLYSPVKKLTFYGNAAYDLDALNGAEIYAEALFSRRLSHQTGTTQFSAFTSGIYPAYDDVYGVYGENPLYPKALRDAGYFLYDPLLILGNTVSSQRVNYLRADGGIRGDIGFKNWHYDANFMYSKNWSRYSIQNPITSRIADSLDLVAAPAGTPSALTVTAGADREGAGGTYTCASNVGASDPQCVPFDVFSPSILAGNIPGNLKAWLLPTETGHTYYEEITGEVNLDGDLFQLPAGALAFSLGASVRHDKLDDEPSIEAQNSDLYNYSSATITKGKDLVAEVYGELSIPIIKNKPFFQDLSAIASGRYTHYRSIGADETYKVSGNWTPFNFIRFRGSYGTSFRAPSLYQLNVADQTGYYGAELDPCSDYQTQNLPSSNRYKNCLAALSPIIGTGNFTPSGGPEAISQGGKGLLKAETSTSLNYGGVFQPKFLPISFAVDYFRIKVKNEVTQLGTDVLNFCYDSTDFSSNFYCGLVDPRNSKTGNLTTFRDPFINVAQQSVDGLDFTARYSQNVGAGKFTANLEATRVLHQKYQEEVGGTIYDYSGTLGNADFAGGPHWTGEVDADYSFKIFDFFYRVQYVGPMNSNGIEDVDTSVDPYDFRTGAYFNHTASVQISAPDNFKITVGVNNFTNAKPKTVSVGASVPRTGNYFDYSGYDFIGRSVFVDISKKF